MNVNPRIFVFCNTANCDGTTEHSMVAIAEDGVLLAGHVCSNHAFAQNDMGIDPNGWKRERYAKHYPDGFQVVWVEQSEIAAHEGLKSALEKAKAPK